MAKCAGYHQNKQRKFISKREMKELVISEKQAAKLVLNGDKSAVEQDAEIGPESDVVVDKPEDDVADDPDKPEDDSQDKPETDGDSKDDGQDNADADTKEKPVVYLAKRQRDRRCKACNCKLSIYNRGTHCWQCQQGKNDPNKKATYNHGNKRLVKAEQKLSDGGESSVAI